MFTVSNLHETSLRPSAACQRLPAASLRLRAASLHLPVVSARPLGATARLLAVQFRLEVVDRLLTIMNLFRVTESDIPYNFTTKFVTSQG